MHPRITDVQATLRYSREKMGLKQLAIGVVALFLGLAIVMYSTDRQLLLPGYVALILGAGLTAYEFYKTANPGKPPLELTPQGIFFRIEGLKEIVIPWHQVRGVETVDVERNGTTFRDVTVALVSKRFYDRAIHTDSILRGPGWESTFIPVGDMVRVAFHTELLPATREELRAAIETRWLAFRDAKPAAAAPRSSGEAA